MNLERPYPPDPYSLLPQVPSFTVNAADFTDGQPLPIDHSVDGADVSPMLSWTGFPAGTQSFVVTCYDPDAPTPAGFWHWTLANLPASVTELPENAGSSDGSLLPAGAVQTRNDGGTVGFTGAAPPAGDHPHRYFFVVHALDVPALDVTGDTSSTAVSFQTIHHTLARAIIHGTYQR